MSETSESAAYVLTTEDIKALKMARSVSFHYHDGAGMISATVDGDGERIYTVTEQRLFNKIGRIGRDREIPVATVMYGYEESGVTGWNLAHTEDAKRASAFEMIHSAQYDLAWVTIVSLMRVGDALTLQWIADNNTENISRVGLHHDELKIIIARGEKTMTFNVDTSTTPDNSARMIKRYGH